MDLLSLEERGREFIDPRDCPGLGRPLDCVAAQTRCTVAMEAYGDAHHWGREIGSLGHAVRLVPPIYVKAYVKRQENDVSDAKAICEASSWPTMRFGGPAAAGLSDAVVRSTSHLTLGLVHTAPLKYHSNSNTYRVPDSEHYRRPDAEGMNS